MGPTDAKKAGGGAVIANKQPQGQATVTPATDPRMERLGELEDLAAAKGWGGLSAKQRTELTQLRAELKPAQQPGPAAATGNVTLQNPFDDATRTQVKSWNTELGQARDGLNKLTQAIGAAKTDTETKYKAIPIWESVTPGRQAHQKVYDTALSHQKELEAGLPGAQKWVNDVDNRITTTLTNVLNASPEFKKRGEQIGTLEKAVTATKEFQAEITSTKKAIDGALSSISSDAMVDGIQAISGDKPTDFQKSMNASREQGKIEAVATAKAKYDTLAPLGKAWKTQIEAFTGENVSGSTGVKVNTSNNTWIPMLGDSMGSNWTQSIESTSALNNSIQLGKAQGAVGALEGQVNDYQEKVTSKLNQLRTTHNNELVSARSKALQ